MAKQTQEKKDAIQIRTERQFLQCKLTPEEQEQAAQDLARLLDDLQGLEEQLTSIKTDFKGKIEQCEANINVKKRLVRDKRELRPVDCEVQSNFTQCTVRVTRKDTGEVIEDRKMTGNEAQLKIADQEGPIDGGK